MKLLQKLIWDHNEVWAWKILEMDDRETRHYQLVIARVLAAHPGTAMTPTAMANMAKRRYNWKVFNEVLAALIILDQLRQVNGRIQNVRMDVVTEEIKVNHTTPPAGAMMVDK